MKPLADTGLAEWKVALLVFLTLIAIAAAHVHSAHQAWTEMRARALPSWWRRIFSYLARHELHYARRMPMNVAFVLVSVVVVANL